MIGCTATYTASTPYDDAYYSSKSAAVDPASTNAVRDDYQTADQNAAKNQTKVVERHIYQEPASQYDYVEPEERSLATDMRQYQEYTSLPERDPQQPVYETQEEYVDEDGQSVVTNNYYYETDDFEDDSYYDYSYSARINRFYRPYNGFNYYAPCYTDLYYYTYDPYYWGTSIYVGTGWGYPYYGGGWSIGFGWGWGSIGFGWGYPSYGWGYPYYGGYYGYNSYWNGYNHGWNDGYYWGSGGGNYARNSYYGPRTRHGNTNGASSPGMSHSMADRASWAR